MEGAAVSGPLELSPSDVQGAFAPCLKVDHFLKDLSIEALFSARRLNLSLPPALALAKRSSMSQVRAQGELSEVACTYHAFPASALDLADH